MARGWESKSIESQIESAVEEAEKSSSRQFTAGQRELQRQRQSLELARLRVQHDLAVATHAGHVAVLEAALQHLDERIKALL
jgi:hypothetical protein